MAFATQQSAPGPPANVNIYVLPAVPGGCPSLLVYPRRKGDTRIHYTRPGQSPTPNLPREVMWVAHGLTPGQMLLIREKSSNPLPGVFPNQPFTIHGPQPWAPSGPPSRGNAIWCYEIILSDGTGQLAYLDPEVEIKDDP